MMYTSKNNVSIRLKSGGHSFSEVELREMISSTDSVDAVVLTPKTVLVPAEVFDNECAQDNLVAVGLAPCLNECVVATEPIDGVVAVMAINAECNKVLRNAAAELTFSTPLLSSKTIEDGSILHIEDGLLYVRVYNKGLQFADVVACKSDADIIYYLAKIDEVYNIFNMSARAMGDITLIKHIAKRLFKELICE